MTSSSYPSWQLAMTCNRCPNTWMSRVAAHCQSCHTTFATIGIFGAHQKTLATCTPPEEMVIRGRPLVCQDGVWDVKRWLDACLDDEPDSSFLAPRQPLLDEESVRVDFAPVLPEEES
jgi:hypothetical protein